METLSLFIKGANRISNLTKRVKLTALACISVAAIVGYYTRSRIPSPRHLLRVYDVLMDIRAYRLNLSPVRLDSSATNTATITAANCDNGDDEGITMSP